MAEQNNQVQMTGQREYKEIAIHFGKGLRGEPFQARDGKTYVEIKIPNVAPNDTRPWESFILPEKSVHENKFGKGLWAKIPEDGHTTLRRPVNVGRDEQDRPIWKYEKRTVPNPELKALIESYKTRNRDRESVTESLEKGRKAMKEKAGEISSEEDRLKNTGKSMEDELPFR